MQIIFKGVCPKCKQDIGLNTDTERKLPELKKMEDYVFEIMKEQSIKAAEKYSKGQIPGPVDQGGFFNDIFNLVEELGGKCPTKPIQYIRNYFHNLKTRIRFTKDKKELQRLKKKITNMKIDVSKNVKNRPSIDGRYEFTFCSRRFLSMLRNCPTCEASLRSLFGAISGKPEIPRGFLSSPEYHCDKKRFNHCSNEQWYSQCIKKEFEKGKRDALKLLKEADKKFNKKSKR